MRYRTLDSPTRRGCLGTSDCHSHRTGCGALRFESSSGSVDTPNRTTTSGQRTSYEAQRNDAGRRIDRVLRRMLPSTPLSVVYRLLRTGAVRLNGARTVPGARVAAGDRIAVPASLAPAAMGASTATAGAERPASTEQPLGARLPVILDNEHVFVTSKPPGITIAGPATERPLPLSHCLEPLLADRVPRSLSFRPVAVHRLDRICSGLLIYAKTIDAARDLTALLRESRATKVYLVVIERVIRRAQLLQARLRYDSTRRRAVIDHAAQPLFAYLRPISTGDGMTLAAVSTHTGRRHQVRALCAEAGMPLAGDRRYGSRRRQRPFLHAWLLCSADPSLSRFTGAPWLEAPPEVERLVRHSADWKRAAAALRARYTDRPVHR